jgi:Ca2+/Na+ antiporter
MNFIEVEKIINELDVKKENIPKDIHEFIICKIFAKYKSDEDNIDYNEVGKDINLEDKGIDVILKSTDSDSKKLYLQLVHSNDYNRNPRNIHKSIDTSGYPIIEAAISKSEKYTRNNIDTSNIILLIEGATIGTSIEDLISNIQFLRIFQNLKCFQSIYYIHNFNNGCVYPLKK